MLNKFVGVPGLEPGKAGPESAVLPLHHTPIKHKNGVYRKALLSNTGAKVALYYKPAKFCGVFFRTICPTAPQNKPL